MILEQHQVKVARHELTQNNQEDESIHSPDDHAEVHGPGRWGEVETGPWAQGGGDNPSGIDLITIDDYLRIMQLRATKDNLSTSRRAFLEYPPLVPPGPLTISSVLLFCCGLGSIAFAHGNVIWPDLINLPVADLHVKNPVLLTKNRPLLYTCAPYNFFFPCHTLQLLPSFLYSPRRSGRSKMRSAAKIFYLAVFAMSRLANAETGLHHNQDKCAVSRYNAQACALAAY